MIYWLSVPVAEEKCLYGCVSTKVFFFCAIVGVMVTQLMITKPLMFLKHHDKEVAVHISSAVVPYYLRNCH